MRRKRKTYTFSEMILTVPPMGWLLIFFLIPTLIAIVMAFHPSDPYGNIGSGWTISNFATLIKPAYLNVIWRTIWISFISTFICMFLAVPVGYYMSRLSIRMRQFVLLLVIVPFWTNFLIRIFAWKLILNPDGIFQKILVSLGIVSKGALLIYNNNAVILVIIYTYLPFAILPIFAAAEKFDYKLLEVARDLGATRWQSFVKVFLPNISSGLKAATFMVLIPCLGSYVIPDLVGGTSSQMVGNLIADQAFVARNIPMAAAWSTVLIAMVIFPIGIVLSTRLISKRL